MSLLGLWLALLCFGTSTYLGTYLHHLCFDQRLATDMSCPGRSGGNCKIWGWESFGGGGGVYLRYLPHLTMPYLSLGSDRVSTARVRGFG